MRQTKSRALYGGLDMVTPAIAMPPGRVIAVANYESTAEGYHRLDGFERLDGHTAPSAASYWVLQFDAGIAAVSEGDTVTGATSGATGVALIDGVVSSGSYGGSDAVGYLVLTEVSGTFQDDEDLQVSAATKCVANGLAVERGATNDTDNTTWMRDAIETARANISAMPGSGDTLGTWHYGGAKWGFRNNAGGTAAVMFKATAAGWVAQDLGLTIDFTSGGTTEIAEGDTITGATSAATATVERAIVTSGSWAGGDAAGRLILSGQTGAFQAENLNVGASTNIATIAGDSAAITLPPGGKYEFETYNFYGAANLKRMYGVNGVGTAFEWDGSVFVPILTGMTVDTPNHIMAHKKHLFLFFPGGSIQHSSIGEPYEWDPVTGAAELSIGEDITGALPEYAKTAIIYGRNKIAVLYGNDSSDWVIDEIANDSGAIEGTVQKMGTPVYLDDRGLRDMRTTQAFGDFRLGTLTTLVEPIFRSKRKAGVTPVASMRVRSKDQYRLFWSDGTGLSLYLGREHPEAMLFDLGRAFTTVCSSEDSDGNEILLGGCDGGFVYQLDSGTSFDGSEVIAYMRLPFDHLGLPEYEKLFMSVALEVDASPSAQIGVSAEFSFADEDQTPAVLQSFDVRGGGGFWDEANWDEFYWSSPVRGRAEAEPVGVGRDISVAIASSAIYEDPHTIKAITYHYSRRRLSR